MMPMTIVTYILLGLLVLAALWTVVTPTLLRSAFGLAFTSALLTMLMFMMDAPLAGVFELSVCSGLITVVFISTIAMTRPLQRNEAEKRRISRAKAFYPLLGVTAWIGALLWMVGDSFAPRLAPASSVVGSVRQVLWDHRRLDLLGQIIIIFVGVFGVVILFKEHKTKSVGQVAKEAGK